MRKIFNFQFSIFNLLLLLIIGYQSSINAAFAQGGPYSGKSGGDGFSLGEITGLGKFLPKGPSLVDGVGAGTMLEKIVSNILAVFTIVGGLMFVLYFVLGALSWITAGGATDKIEKAKNQMINAVIGLIIIVAAYAIIYIVGLVLGMQILKPAEELQKIKP